MDDQACPRCKTTKYRNPALRLLVNVCGHALCDHCVDLLFTRGTGACPECGTALKRSNFKLQLFEDPEVEKEVDVRKKILKDFNKKEEDFESLRAYNDYLEEIETIVFNLTYGIDVDETKRKVEQYKKENKELIMKNKSKMSADQLYIQELLDQEEQQRHLARQLAAEEQLTQQKVKVSGRENLINELMFSELPALQILAQHREQQASQEEEVKVMQHKKRTEFSTGISIGKQEGFLPVPKQVEHELYVYTPPVLEVCGPELPSLAHLDEYMDYVRPVSEQELAGGFKSQMACQRALHEAFSGLFYSYPAVVDTGHQAAPTVAPSSSRSAIDVMDFT